MKIIKRKLLGELGLIILAIFLMSLFSRTGLMQVLELKALDWRFQLRKTRPVSDEIMLIGIDDPSIETLGRWPWSRGHHAAMIKALSDRKYRPKTIGFDILFTELSESFPERDQRLVEATEAVGNVIYAYFFEADRQKAILPFPELAEVSQGGFINAPPDRDGVTRFSPLIIEVDGKFYPSLDLRLVMNYLEISPQDMQITRGKYISVEKSLNNAFKIPIDNQFRILINYAADLEGFNGYSALGILKAAGQLKKGEKPCIPLTDYKDKIALVGLTATGTTDLRATPFSPKSPMVSVHTNIINSILKRDFLFPVSRWINHLMFVLLGLSVGFISLRLKPLRSILTVLGVLACYLAVNFYLFTRQGLWLAIADPLAVILFVYLVMIGYRYIVEEREKRWVKKAFGHYLPASVMDEILSDPGKLKLGGEKKELSVLFADIKSFTPYCERHSPEEVVHTLNEYFDRMTEIVFKYNGTLDKFIGDALVVIFGAPSKYSHLDHAKRACLTALDMSKELKVLQEQWQGQGKELLDIGIGINTGEMLVGNMGSSKIMDYTVIGDEVNLASRVQGLTRDYNVKTIITEATYQKVKEIVEVRPLGEAKVKGKDKTVVIYELIRLKPEDRSRKSEK
ncbi:MAG: adenylate/guanylate cyclase domain-containing protein [Candidatus Omnitrophota bacterium]|nr:adenylate/guanylate cyclase domain-containing protein [Candidatus Omnitrophota bacterium]